MKGSIMLMVAVAVVTAVAGYFIWRSSRPNDIGQPNPAREGAAIGGGIAPLPSTPAQGNSVPENSMLKTYKFPGVLPQAEIQNKTAVIKTAKGEIKFEILADEGPKAASNFVYLTKEGYYDGLNFHRVESWVIQGGDPNCGSTSSPSTATGRCGTGGPGYKFEDEPVRLPYKTGIVAMANAGPDTNGSQFFILKRDTPLPPNYTIFGRLISGMDVVQKIAPGDVVEKVEIISK